MNIATIYKEMEDRTGLNLPIYLGYLKEHVNSTSFNFDEVLGKDRKYLRALACAALDIKNYKGFYNLIRNDSHMPVFTTHMSLIKCSAELLNPDNDKKDLETLLENVIQAVINTKVDNFGTTLSFAFGFVLGTAIKSGINVKIFFNKLDARFIKDNGKLFQGFSTALQSHCTSLVLNNQYVNDLSDRYDNWEDRSRILSLSIFKAIPTEMLTSITPNKENLNVLEYFSGRTSSYDKFLSDYKAHLKALNFKEESQNFKTTIDSNPASSLFNDKEINEESNGKELKDSSSDLEKKITQQQQEISSLTNELSLYKSVFKQFETIFPDLEKTLNNSANNKELLTKIQNLVNEQNNNIKNLQGYYEEGEKQKAIKDGFKKRL